MSNVKVAAIQMSCDDNQQNNQSSYHIDSRTKEEERRINEWGLDDDWRWGRL